MRCAGDAVLMRGSGDQLRSSYNLSTLYVVSSECSKYGLVLPEKIGRSLLRLANIKVKTERRADYTDAWSPGSLDSLPQFSSEKCLIQHMYAERDDLPWLLCASCRCLDGILKIENEEESISQTSTVAFLGLSAAFA